MTRSYLAIFWTMGLTVAEVSAGPFPVDSIPASDARFTMWAIEADVVRGPSDIAFTEEPIYYPTFGDASSATGPADVSAGDFGNPFPVVSLGDGGMATLTFENPIADGAGPDFAVFENAFNTSFLELAHVEVSSDGIHFYRFPSVSLTQTATQLGNFGALDPTNLYNLAGKAPGGSGTPFDLAQLRRHAPLLDVNRITQVRVIDVVGSLSPSHGSLDSLGNPINDPYPTDHEFGGFDLDAVGAFFPVLTTYADWVDAWKMVGDDALPTADPDHDGVPNFITYLTGDGTLTIDGTPEETTLRFNRLSYRTDGKLRIESSATLGDWQSVAESLAGGPMTVIPGTQATVGESGENLVQVTVSLPSLLGARYFRLAAEP